MIEPRRPQIAVREVCAVVKSAITGWGRTARLCAVIMTIATAFIVTAIAIRIAGLATAVPPMRPFGRL